MSLRPFPSRGRGGFSLLEVLVVLAIILLIIALLMPTLRKAHRAAQVLASPLAYVGVDQRVHLTDPAGKTDITLSAPIARNGCPVCHSPPAWSPSGLNLAVVSELPGGIYRTWVIDPMADRSKAFDAREAFLSWSDNDHIIMGTRAGFATRRAEGGGTFRLAQPPQRPMSLSAAPLTAPFPYAGIVTENGYAAVALLRKDLSVGRIIWREIDGHPLGLDWPVIDPTGEHIAWTRRMGAFAGPIGQVGQIVAVKSLRDPSSRPPLYVATDFRSACFCDWTEHGQLLVNATQDGKDWNLWIMDRRGRRVRRIDPPVPPLGGSVATWRKYGRK